MGVEGRHQIPEPQQKLGARHTHGAGHVTGRELGQGAGVEHHHVGALRTQLRQLLGGDRRRATLVADAQREVLAGNVERGQLGPVLGGPGRDAAVEGDDLLPAAGLQLPGELRRSATAVIHQHGPHGLTRHVPRQLRRHLWGRQVRGEQRRGVADLRRVADVEHGELGAVRQPRPQCPYVDRVAHVFSSSVAAFTVLKHGNARPVGTSGFSYRRRVAKLAVDRGGLATSQSTIDPVRCHG